MPNKYALMGLKVPVEQKDSVKDAIEDADPRFELMTPQEIRDALEADGHKPRAFVFKYKGHRGPGE